MTEPLRFDQPDADVRTASNWVHNNLATPGVICPCCTQIAALRKRNLHSAMAAALVLFYRHQFSGGPEWIHGEDFLKNYQGISSTLRGDFAKLRFWHLLERYEGPRGRGRPRNGCYRVTRTGALFVNGGVTVPQFLWTFNNRAYPDASAPQISIRDALATDFNYQELITGVSSTNA